MCDKIYTIDEIKSIAAPIAKQHGVAALYLFGSYARGEATSASDLDFRIEKGELRSLLHPPNALQPSAWIEHGIPNQRHQ